MAGFFPRTTIAWKLEEPAAFRAITLSIVESGLLAGVILRLVRALALSYIPERHWVLFSLLRLGLALVLFAAAAAHLSNYPVRHWLWRAPVFGLLAALAAMATSLVLIAVHRERLGTAPAGWVDWPSLAWRVLAWDVASVSVFAFLLAGVVQVVRSALVRRERSSPAPLSAASGR
jgi:hypothetical protein